VVRGRRTLSCDLLSFVDLEARQLQVLRHPLGEHLARVVRRVLLKETAQQGAAAGDRNADRKREVNSDSDRTFGRISTAISRRADVPLAGPIGRL
jgi:hypothetical protein